MSAAYGVQSMVEEMTEAIAAANGDAEVAIAEVITQNSNQGIPARAWLVLLVEAVAQLAEAKAGSQ
jgi:hypothetical protein